MLPSEVEEFPDFCVRKARRYPLLREFDASDLELACCDLNVERLAALQRHRVAERDGARGIEQRFLSETDRERNWVLPCLSAVASHSVARAACRDSRVRAAVIVRQRVEAAPCFPSSLTAALKPVASCSADPVPQ